MAGNVVREVDSFVTVKRALLSVSDKTGLEALVLGLIAANPAIELYSTGGTHAAIAKLLGENAARNLIAVSDYTGQPETQGGLVKTRRGGTTIYYSLADDSVRKLIDMLCDRFGPPD